MVLTSKKKGAPKHPLSIGAALRCASGEVVANRLLVAATHHAADGAQAQDHHAQVAGSGTAPVE